MSDLAQRPSVLTMSSARHDREFEDTGAVVGSSNSRDPLAATGDKVSKMTIGGDGGSSAIESASDISGNARGTVCRTLTVEIAGSLTKLAAAGIETRWGVDKNSSAVFQPVASDKGYSDIAGKCDISNAVLHSMTVKEVRSTFPCTIGVNIAGVVGTHATREGIKYALVVQKDTKHHINKSVVTPDEMTNSEYLKKYPGMTPDKISTEGIVKVPGEEYVFVDSNHPIVEMLIVNEEVLQVNMKNAELIDGRWYKVSSEVVTDCAKLLDQQLLQHLPLIDLSAFEIKAERLGKIPWDRTDAIADDLAAQKNVGPLVERLMTRKNTLSLEIELEYSFM